MGLIGAGHRDHVGVIALGVATAALAAILAISTALFYRRFFADVLLVTNAGLVVFSALALVGACTGSARLRRASAIAALAWVLGPLVTLLFEALRECWCSAFRPPLWGLALVIAAATMTLVVVVDLARGRRAARVVAIAGGWAGVSFFGVLLAWVVAARPVAGLLVNAEEVWWLALMIAASALPVAALSGRPMAEHFESGPRRDVVRAPLTASAMLNAALAALLVFNGLRYWHGLHLAVSLAAAAVLGASAILTLRGRTAGLLLAIPGAAAAALLGPLVLSAPFGASSPSVSPLAFAPALLAALLGLAPLARPMWRFVRDPRAPQGRERPLP